MNAVLKYEILKMRTKLAMMRIAELGENLLELDEYLSAEDSKYVWSNDELEQRAHELIKGAVERRRRLEKLLIPAVDAVWQIIVGCTRPHNITIECHCGRWRCGPPMLVEREAKR